ncbi:MULTISPECIES: DUF4239 domain-containing protein [Methylobacterium]|uniref:DUF4239 domain-containing protein n=1 Tax=Methylobacterium jeotgali TaxID=381630 RepID=A0ABQ4SRC7_9HYPH|nr:MULTISPECIES: DUF4239 domain-containing protein [Methylobacterium]PIU08558.1 MAG: hypothetical protein COT56_00900 [Methylobacterium sp. CG09_land_8_20_14_0_10_71_15]PIU11361.1 MAG: hypothetical protein COT28_20410 [Methylobacterium sp. CG08_land_8_20_14_0_20_71_15]GBU19129.1 hypothetical protein AwMethylo_33440 [Methylobacterium sp.]GJE05771.1 hypothetical protein AOPFMNJM_1077 [Methylobacterium jeotgali]
MILGFWLDQPVWLIFALLGALLAGVVGMIRLVATLPLTRGRWLRLTGLVAPYFSSISVLLALFTGFVANDAWERQRQAVRTVQTEGDTAVAIYDLSLATVSDMAHIRAHLAAYLRAVTGDEWHQMQTAQASPKAAEALALLLQAVVVPSVGADAGAASQTALLDLVLRLRAARSDRLSLAQSNSDETKWLALVILASLTLLALALVHIESPRAQVTAMTVFSIAMTSTLGLIALHERPFDGPLPVSAKPLSAALARVVARPPPPAAAPSPAPVPDARPESPPAAPAAPLDSGRPPG